MSKKITIKAGNVIVNAELNDTRTSQLIWEKLPIAAKANLWGEEIYFSIPVEDKLDNAKEMVNVGDLGYWPPEQAFCIFFGPTPITSSGPSWLFPGAGAAKLSSGATIKPASAVNIIGRVTGDAAQFKSVKSGEKVIIERLD